MHVAVLVHFQYKNNKKLKFYLIKLYINSFSIKIIRLIFSKILEILQKYIQAIRLETCQNKV